MSVTLKLAALIGLLGFAGALGQPQRKPQPHRYAEVTSDETLWRGRYANCDYGFYVILPAGFVAHSSRPPNPNHGFLVALPDVGRTQYASSADERFVWTNAEYNSLDFTSLKAAADYQLSVMRAKAEFRELTDERFRFDAKPAIKIKGEYDGLQGRVVEERVVALRAGIVYEVGLMTKVGDYPGDKKAFDRILSGFHFWRIHYC